jgi:hypothetical protein
LVGPSEIVKNKKREIKSREKIKEEDGLQANEG